MVKVALTGGAYTAHSVIAAAQRCVNLFPETGPRTATSAGTHVSETGEPSTVAHYPTPGTRFLGTIGTGPIRGIRQCTTGGVYVVSGSEVYSIDTSAWTGTLLGSITPGLRTPVSMQDNGLDMVIVDGTANGWDVTLAANTMAPISDPSGMFSGADRVDYLDTYFLFNKPATPQFYISGSLAVTFDLLDYANKEAYPDLLVTVIVSHRLVYLLGERTSEIWYDAGVAGFSATDPAVASTFQFAPMQSQVFIDHGCAAKYSPAVYDNYLFWLTKDRQGQGIVMRALGETTVRVSTFAIEAEIAGYDRISDAIGFTYQLAGHSFYVMTFPEADRTWSYDITTGQWHEWLWIDSNGAEHRHRANCYWAVNDLGVIGDWQNGNLYALDNRVFTDNGHPIKRVRAFPHLLADGKRVFYRQLLADMETGWAPEMLSGTETRLDATFTAADGTPLASYVSEVGGGWAPIGGEANAQIGANKVIGTGGTALYQSAATILTPDYTLRFDAVPPVDGSVVADTSLWAIGRAAGGNTGYRVMVSADGTQYTLTLAVLPSGASASVVMGTIASGRFTIWLLLRGSNITAQAQRSVDSMWLRTDGTWHTDPGTIASQFTDATYAAAGAIMIGGIWPTPTPAVPASLRTTSETLPVSDPNFPSGYSYYSTIYGYGFRSFDFSRNIYYALISHGSTIGIAITDLSTMSVVRTVTLAQMYAGTAYGSPPGTPRTGSVWDIATGNNTDIYIMTGPSKSSPYFTRIDPVTLKVTGEFTGANHDPNNGAVNKTATHTVVAYSPAPAWNLGAEVFDGTGMTLLGFATSPTYPGYGTNIIPGGAHADGSCDFVMTSSDLGGSGLIDIWRVNVSDGLVITTTKTGTFDANAVYDPLSGTDAWIGQINYDAAHDSIIYWLQNRINGPPTWLTSVNWDGSVKWTQYLADVGTVAGNRGQSQLVGSTLMTGSAGDLKLIDTGTGGVIFTGAISHPLTDYFYQVWDASRDAYWTYGLSAYGFTRIDFIAAVIPPTLALDNVIATATPALLSTNLVSLRWSDDRGHSFGSPVSQSIGEAGEYRTSLQWQRLSFARDRVFEISWSVPCRTALQGCWVDVTPAQS